MTPIFVILLILGIILYLKVFPKMQIKKNTLISIGIGLVVVLLLISSIRIIQPGYVGVQVLLGKVNKNVLSNGIHFVLPIVELKRMNVRTQEYTMSVMKGEGEIKGDDAITALSKDGLTIRLDITVWYKLDPNEAAKVFQNLGTNYVKKIVRPAIRTAIRDAAVMYNATDIYSSKREELTNKIDSMLSVSVEDKGIIVDRILLRNLTLPAKVKNAIDEKIAAKQDAEKMQYVLQKERKEKERRLIEAEGIANAQKAISASLNKQYLQWYYIQNLKEVVNSQNTKIVIMPFDKTLTPLINLGN